LITSMLECATRLAGLFSGTVEGVALRLPQISIVGPDPVVTVTFPRTEQKNLEILSTARQMFDTYIASATATSMPKDQRPRHRWRAIDPIDDATLANLTHIYNLTIVNHPQNNTAGPRITTLETILFENGQPLLIAPPITPQSLGKRII